MAVQGAPSSCSNLISFNATKLSVSLRKGKKKWTYNTQKLFTSQECKLWDNKPSFSATSVARVKTEKKSEIEIYVSAPRSFGMERSAKRTDIKFCFHRICLTHATDFTENDGLFVVYQTGDSCAELQF